MTDETRSIPNISQIGLIGVTQLIGAADGVLDAMIAALEGLKVVGVGVQQSVVNIEGKTADAMIAELKDMKAKLVTNATAVATATADAIPDGT